MTTDPTANVEITGYRPGAIGRITELHATYYSDHWDFGLYFEAKVASGLAEFLQRADDRTDRLWLAWLEGRMVGSIAIDGSEDNSAGAHLRWFILAPDCQGRGLGRRLLGLALEFCRTKGFPLVYLWTFAGLDSAKYLYETNGFQLAEEVENDQWGRIMQEQRFVLDLGRA